MGKVQIGNIYYFIPLLIIALIGVGVFFLLRGKSQKTIKIVLVAWLFVNLALHFLKQFDPSYSSRELTSVLHKSTLENICAVSTVVFPFVLLFVKKESKLFDFIFFISIIGGFLGCFIPTEVLREDRLLTFESIRFYICHGTLLLVPVEMALLNYHRPNIKNFWTVPIFFLGYETIIFLNELVLFKTGYCSSTSWSDFFDRNQRNNSFVFGPTNDFGDIVKGIFDFLTPNPLQVNFFNIPNIDEFYFPVLWIFIPCCFLLIPLYLLVCLIFKKKNKTIEEKASIKNKNKAKIK